MTRHVPRSLSVRTLWCSLLMSGGLLLPALVSTRAADPVVSARWRDGGLVLDGSIADWPDLARVGAGPGVAVQNDGSTLYLAVAAKDPAVRLQLATGLIVWLDGTAREAQTFGVRLEGLAPRPLRGTTPDSTTTDLTSRGLSLNTLDEFDLLGPARNQRRLIERPADIGIALASSVEDGTVIYELKVPLEQTVATPHAVGAKPGATITVGLETPTDPKQPRGRNRLDNPMNTNAVVIDPYGGYFDPLPPGGRSSDAPKDVAIKPMKLLWALVRLATAPSIHTAR